MAESISFPVPGAIGNDAGPENDGVLVGQLTPTDPAKVLLKSLSGAGLAISDDGGLYVQLTTPFGEATADDVPVLPAAPAVDDAMFYGHATGKFSSVEQNITTQGAGTWTIVWEYWNGSAYTALAGVTDGTTGFTAATGWVSTSFTVPTDWVQNTVDGVLGYWVRARVSAFTSITTQPLIGEGYVALTSAAWTDDTTDFTDAGAGDVDLLPANPAVGDGLYIVHSEKYCKIKITTSQAGTGTYTITPKYWNGTAYAALATFDDDTNDWTVAAGTYFIHFIPPSDWAANTAANGPDGNAGYTIAMELTALTDVTQQPQATQGWVLPLITGADGIKSAAGGSLTRVQMQAQTKSATNADSEFLIVNANNGQHVQVTWTAGDPTDIQEGISMTLAAGHKLLVVQATEDGTTEFADVNFELTV